MDGLPPSMRTQALSFALKPVLLQTDLFVNCEEAMIKVHLVPGCGGGGCVCHVLSKDH